MSESIENKQLTNIAGTRKQYWNVRFNQTADLIQPFTESVPFRGGLIGGFERAFVDGLGKLPWEALYRLVDLGAKATGGRKLKAKN